MRHYLNMSLLLFYGFGCIKASESERFARDELYKKYFQQQEKIYQELLKSGIPGARPLDVDEVLAESVLATSPKKIKQIISRIEQNVFFKNEKNIILHGMSGTGKSAIAQAIAIKCQVPCLIFKAGTISTTYMNSGVQNLNKIFEHAKKLEKKHEKPCVIIFDELEALTKKHAGKDNHENNILMSFWQELDELSNGRVVVIGTMNKTEEVPVQIINRTSMIEVPLSNLEERAKTLSYHSKKIQEKYKLAYSESDPAAWLARLTKGFSNRDLENLMTRATEPVILEPVLPDRSNKFVKDDDFVRVIKQIKKSPQWKLEREIGTWKHAFKTSFRDPKTALPVAALAVSLAFLYNQRESIALQKEGQFYQKDGIALQREGIAIQREGLEQSQKIADKQMSTLQISKQGAINSAFSTGFNVIAHFFGLL